MVLALSPRPKPYRKECKTSRQEIGYSFRSLDGKKALNYVEGRVCQGRIVDVEQSKQG